MNNITITQPDDWHLHLRDGAEMASVVGHTTEVFKRALVMPNLMPPVTTVALAREYRDRILEELSDSSQFEPWMAIYLTKDTTPDIIKEAKDSGFILVGKLYPSGVTTNSSNGVASLDQIDSVFEEMQKQNLPLSIHGETADPECDFFDREKRFVENELQTIVNRYPELKIVLEHISTREAVQYIEEAPSNLAATITAHHLILNRNDIFSKGLNPHHFCMPIVKSEKDRLAVVKAATSGNPKFFLGTDSAPHAKSLKESGSGKAGVYSAPVALAVYAELFDSEGCLDYLEGFASFWGADFYSLPRNAGNISLEKKEWTVPEAYDYANAQLVPLRAGKTISWQIKN